MTLFSQGHYDLIAMFEREFTGLRLDKEDKALWSKGNIYQSGEANQLFLAYRKGFALAKASSQSVSPGALTITAQETPMADWQTIESAPQNGTECWLAVWSHGEVGTTLVVARGFFDVGSGRWLDAEEENDDGDNTVLYPPTHWMPFVIPNPPAIRAVG